MRQNQNKRNNQGLKNNDVIFQYIIEMNLEEKDFIIIKNSTNWATRSLLKLRLLFDKVFGEEIKSIHSKAYTINSILKDILDSFVSGSTLYGEDSKTANDHEAITSFIICGNNFNNIVHQIEYVILPNLAKIGINITVKDSEEPSKQQNKKDKKSFNRNEAIKELQSNIEDLYNVVLNEDLNKDDVGLLMKSRNELISIIENNLESIKSESEESAENIYDNTINQYDNFISIYKDKIQRIASEAYSIIIKSATSAEEITSYYLMSFGEYSKFFTPIKEKFLAVKNFIGLGGDETIYSMRLDCMKYTKNLIEESAHMVTEIEKAASIKDQEEKWIRIIETCNRFAEEYNRYRTAYVEMYSIMKIKVNQDKLKKKKKEVGNVSDVALKDFVEHSWVDMPARTDKRFPMAIIIKV